jgi:hypothetical protein
MELKQDHKTRSVIKIFETIRTQSKINFDPMITATREWPQKQRHFLKLNEHLMKRLKDYFTSWQKNAEAMKYCNKIMDEKKKRVLQNISKLLLQQDVNTTRKTIESFDRNRRIHNLQINFLRKLCDGKIGKMHGIFTLWKGLPEPNNKARIINATTFASNLSEMLKRNLKFTLKVLSRERRKGQERKYQGVSRLVAIKCGDIGHYFHKWVENKRLTDLSIKNQKAENFFHTILSHHSYSFNMLFRGDEIKNKIKSLELVERYWNRQKQWSIKQWSQNANKLKLRDISRRHLLKSLINIQRQV